LSTAFVAIAESAKAGFRFNGLIKLVYDLPSVLVDLEVFVLTAFGFLELSFERVKLPNSFTGLGLDFVCRAAAGATFGTR
jgi:hypothetical protein